MKNYCKFIIITKLWQKIYSAHVVISTEASPEVYSGRAKWRNPSMLSFRLERVKRAEWRNPLNFNLRDPRLRSG